MPSFVNKIKFVGHDITLIAEILHRLSLMIGHQFLFASNRLSKLGFPTILDGLAKKVKHLSNKNVRGEEGVATIDIPETNQVLLYCDHFCEGQHSSLYQKKKAVCQFFRKSVRFVGKIQVHSTAVKAKNKLNI